MESLNKVDYRYKIETPLKSSLKKYGTNQISMEMSNNKTNKII